MTASPARPWTSTTRVGLARASLSLWYFVRKVLWSLREVGPRGVADKAVSKASDYAFDLRYGTDTCRWTPLSRLAVPEHGRLHGTDYQPTGRNEFQMLMDTIDLPRSGAFIDFGSGKGRVVLMASRFGFRRVIGVELSEELCAVARTNVEKHRRKAPGSAPVEIVCADAASYVVDDDAIVFFLFNPFDEIVIKQVLTTISESLHRRRRRVHLIYSNAQHAAVIDDHPLFEVSGRYSYPRAYFTVYVSGVDANEKATPRGATQVEQRAESIPSPRPVLWGGVLARVRASVGLRRLVPTSLALVGTDLLCRLVLGLSSRRLASAEVSMRAIVGGTPAEPNVSRLARGQIAARARGRELTWRPWELERVPIRGISRIREARATGRGVLISYSHLGPLAACLPLARLLEPLYAPVGDWALDEPGPGYIGYYDEHRRKIFRDAGITLIRASGSARALVRVLSSGGAVILAMDLPGSRRTQFMGKPVDMADGTARLAAMTDALVVPGNLMPLGRRWEMRISDSLDPRDFSSPAELHHALAAIHESFVMRAPNHLESPLLPGRWPTATSDGWYRG